MEKVKDDNGFALVVHSRDNLIGGCTIGDQFSLHRIKREVDLYIYKRCEIVQFDNLETFIRNLLSEFTEQKTETFIYIDEQLYLEIDIETGEIIKHEKDFNKINEEDNPEKGYTS